MLDTKQTAVQDMTVHVVYISRLPDCIRTRLSYSCRNAIGIVISKLPATTRAII